MKSCKATVITLSPCVLLDPDIQELIYSVLDIKELLSVDLVCKGTRVTKDKYLKAIQSYAFNKVERFLNFIAEYRVGKGILAHLKPVDLIDGFYDSTQLDSAWKFASNIDNDLEIRTIEIRNKLIHCANTRETSENTNTALPIEVPVLESLCRKQLKRHIEDIFICHFALGLKIRADNLNFTELTTKMVQMALHSTPELTFKLSALDTAIYRETIPAYSPSGYPTPIATIVTSHYRLMMSTQAHDYLQQRGLSAINQRFEENNIIGIRPLAQALYKNTTIIDGNQDPIIYATGLEILQICREE